MFGVFSETYKKWQNQNIQTDFTQFFAQSDILNGRDMAVYKALLYFNLPQNVVFKQVKPVKVFNAYHGSGKTLKDLVNSLDGN